MLSLLLALAALADDVVTLDGRTWRALQPPEPPPAIAAPTGVLDRRVTLARQGDGWRVTAIWTVRAAASTDLRLVGPGPTPLALTVDGRPAAGDAAPDGLHLLVPRGSTTVGLVALVPAGPDGAATVDLLPAVRGEVRGPEGYGIAVDGAAAWLPELVATGAGRIAIAPEAPRTTDTRPLAVARAAVGLTVGDGALAVHGRVAWLLRRGRLDVVRLDVPGAGADLRVTGADVAEVVRAGDEVTVRLHHPADRVDLDLRWTATLPAGDHASLRLPTITPRDALHVERAAVLARDTELEVVPEVRGDAALPETLPGWADGLVEGEPTAAWTGEASGTVEVLRYVPAEQPPVMIDLASLEVAVSTEGRSLVAVTLSVRNERGAHLVVRPPPGHALTAVAIDGVPAPASRIRDGEGDAWRIDIPRSVETVQGLLSFPVELTLLGDHGPAWARRVDAPLPLPRFDAPVAVRRVTVNLPRGWSPDLEVGKGGVVDAFTEGEGLSYGFGVDDEARATVLYKQAVQAWMENDFDVAGENLAALEAMGADNQNVVRLRSNLDVVEGKDVQADEAAVRRVREQAQARAFDDYRKQDEALKKAKEAEASGDEDRAAAAYAEVAGYAGKLGALEQEESVRQESYATEARDKLEAIEARNTRGKRADADIPEPPPPPVEFAEEAWSVGDVELGVEGVEGGVVGGVVGGVLGGEALDEDTRRALESLGYVDTPEPAPAPTVPYAEAAGAAFGDGRPLAPPPEPAAVEESEVGFDGAEVTGDVLQRIEVERTVRFPVREEAGRGPARPGGPKTRAPEDKPADPDFDGEVVVGTKGVGHGQGYGRGSGSGGGGAAVTGTFSVTLAPATAAPAAGNELPDLTAELPPAKAPAPDEPALVVTATGTAAIVPVVGETVRFQHVLLDPGDDVTVRVAAHEVHSRRSR